MNLAERRRGLMMQQIDGNLFNINNVKICYRNSYAKGFVHEIKDGIIWSGGKSGHSSGGLIYVPLKPADKVKFSADLHFIRDDMSKNNTAFEIWGFNGVGDDNIIIGVASVLCRGNISPTQDSISLTIDASGYSYIGFCFWTEEQYVMGLSDIKIIKEV